MGRITQYISFLLSFNVFRYKYEYIVVSYNPHNYASKDLK